MPTNACSKPSTNNYAADLGAGPAIHKTGKQTSSQRELCQRFVSAPPRKALAVVSSRAPLPFSPVAPADYHFRYLLLIGEKERLGLRFRRDSVSASARNCKADRRAALPGLRTNRI